MADRDQTHTTNCYLQLRADTWESASGPRVRAFKVIGVTQKRPTHAPGGTVIVKLGLELPDAAFLPLSPEATVVVPLALVDTTPIVVEAVEQ